MVATAIYSVTMVLWKDTAFLLCRAMERRWKYYYYFYFLPHVVKIPVVKNKKAKIEMSDG